MLPALLLKVAGEMLFDEEEEGGTEGGGAEASVRAALLCIEGVELEKVLLTDSALRDVSVC